LQRIIVKFPHAKTTATNFSAALPPRRPAGIVAPGKRRAGGFPARQAVAARDLPLRLVAGEQIAVKALDERGNELMVVKRTDEAVK